MSGAIALQNIPHQFPSLPTTPIYPISHRSIPHHPPPHHPHTLPHHRRRPYALPNPSTHAPPCPSHDAIPQQNLQRDPQRHPNRRVLPRLPMNCSTNAAQSRNKSCNYTREDLPVVIQTPSPYIYAPRNAPLPPTCRSSQLTPHTSVAP